LIAVIKNIFQIKKMSVQESLEIIMKAMLLKNPHLTEAEARAFLPEQPAVDACFSFAYETCTASNEVFIDDAKDRLLIQAHYLLLSLFAQTHILEGCTACYRSSWRIPNFFDDTDLTFRKKHYSAIFRKRLADTEQLAPKYGMVKKSEEPIVFIETV
jgi:hypothetical protein